jgi:putative spermidine/putrescine transport system permease protein
MRQIAKSHGTTLMLAPALLVLGGPFLGGLLFGLAQSLGLFSVVDVGGPTLAFYAEALGSADFARSLALTAYVAGVATLLAAALSLGLALLLRRAFRGARMLRLLVQLPLPAPHIVAAIGVALLLGQSGMAARLLHAAGLVAGPADFPALVYDRGAVGLIVAYVWKETPFITLVTLAALRSAGSEVEHAARNLGATPWQTLRYVTLPLVGPALLGAATIVFTFTFGAFEAPLLLGQSYPRTLAVEAYVRYQDTDLAARPAALALNTLIAGLTALAAPPYIWLLRRAGSLGHTGPHHWRPETPLPTLIPDLPERKC